MIHLDTHAVVWLYEGRTERFPEGLRRAMGARRPLISPVVRLELAFLNEIGRLRVSPADVIESLRVHADLGTAESRFERVAAIAEGLTWTRDPFDRLIVAHALADDLPLVTKDEQILANCPLACWEGLPG